MKGDSKYRWLLLVLAAFTFSAVITGPGSSLAVLFEEIAAELHLDLVQVGLIWGIGSLLAIFTGSISGALIDRFGPKRVILTGIVLASIAAGLRGTAGSFSSLIIAILFFGGVVPMVSTSGFKIASIWFPHRLRGVAYGILSMGMALGLLLSTYFSATVLSPWLGGWRNVMFFFGGLGLLFSVPWLFLHPDPEKTAAGGEEVTAVPIRQALSHIVRRKELWLLGFTFLGIGGCQQGIMGYLALYLRGIGWAGADADAAVSLMYAVNLLCILPMGWVSDRMRSRKTILLAALLVMMAGGGLIALTAGAGIYAAVVLLGMMRDGSASVLLTMAVETKDVGPVYAGTASGFVMTFFFLGSLTSPPVGNALAGIAPGLPFFFWAACAGLGFASLSLLKAAKPAVPA